MRPRTAGRRRRPSARRHGGRRGRSSSRVRPGRGSWVASFAPRGFVSAASGRRAGRRSSGGPPPTAWRLSATLSDPSSASTASTRRLSSSVSGSRSFRKIACTWRSIARGLRNSCFAIARLERPSASSASTSRSRSVSSSSSDERRAADEAVDDLGIERGAAGRDAFDRLDEVGDVPHAILEQVADSRGVVSDELEHVRRLDVLREHEYGDRRVRAPDLRGGDQPVVRVPRRHADVDDRDVREVGADLEEQVVGVPCAADDLVPRVLEQRCDPLAQQRVVVGDHDAERARRALSCRSRSGVSVA